MVSDCRQEYLASIVYPEDGGSRFLRSVGTFLQTCIASHLMREVISEQKPSDWLRTVRQNLPIEPHLIPFVQKTT
jgi:hypothetical protein